MRKAWAEPKEYQDSIPLGPPHERTQKQHRVYTYKQAVGLQVLARAYHNACVLAAISNEERQDDR